MVKEISKFPHKNLTKKELIELATLIDPGTILRICKKAGWSVEEGINQLIEITNNDTNKGTTRLSAVKFLIQLVTGAMERSGLMVMATKKYVGEDGEEVRFSGQVVSSILRGQKEQTTPAQLLVDTVGKEDKDGESRSEKRENGEDESGEDGKEKTVKRGERQKESSLHTSKPPTGREAESGHFDGISRGSEGSIDEDNSGDFL